MPLVIVESPYRALVEPVVTYLDVLDHAWPPGKEAPTTIVVLPEYVARHWWDRLLYNQAAKRLKAALVGREHTVIADVPYRRSEHSPGSEPAPGTARGRPEHAHDRRAATPHRPQARRSARPRRAAARGVLPLHGPQPARREAEAVAARGPPSARRPPRSKAWLIGRPLATEEEIGERLSKRLALPIFSSDAISSSAYATEEILRVLVVGGALAFVATIQVAAAIAVMLAVVAISYRQVCRAFPNGGGAYAVARQELTPLLGLVAAAALLIDYVMTVAVSTSSAVEQLISIAPDLNSVRVAICLDVDHADHDRQPARPARVGEHLRDPDLPVRGARAADRGDRRGPDHRPATPAPPPPHDEAMDLGHARPSGSCCCSRRSPAAPSR